MNLNEPMFPGILGAVEGSRQDAQAHSQRVVDPARADRMQELNRRELIELSTIVGHEGTDYQNPYAWAATGVLAYPSPHGSELVPGYGIGGAQDPQSVYLNVVATRGAIQA